MCFSGQCTSNEYSFLYTCWFEDSQLHVSFSMWCYIVTFTQLLWISLGDQAMVVQIAYPGNCCLLQWPQMNMAAVISVHVSCVPKNVIIKQWQLFCTNELSAMDANSADKPCTSRSALANMPPSAATSFELPLPAISAIIVTTSLITNTTHISHCPWI